MTAPWVPSASRPGSALRPIGKSQADVTVARMLLRTAVATRFVRGWVWYAGMTFFRLAPVVATYTILLCRTDEIDVYANLLLFMSSGDTSGNADALTLGCFALSV